MKTIISFSSRHDRNCAQVGKLIQSMNSESVLYDFQSLKFMPAAGAIMSASKSGKLVFILTIWNAGF